MLSHEDVLNEFRSAGALLEGHFVLSSGLHSARYLQCARVLMDAKRATRLCASLAKSIHAGDHHIDIVASPAMGGVVVGYEMGRQMNVPAIFFERVEGKFDLRRGFNIEKNARVLMVEDIITTGLSSRECIEAIEVAGGICVAAACLINRSGGKADVGVPLYALTSLEIPTYAANALPSELAAIPAIKPGSRNMPK